MDTKLWNYDERKIEQTKTILNILKTKQKFNVNKNALKLRFNSILNRFIITETMMMSKGKKYT